MRSTATYQKPGGSQFQNGILGLIVLLLIFVLKRETCSSTSGKIDGTFAKKLPSAAAGGDVCIQKGTSVLSSTASNGNLVIDKSSIRNQSKDKIDKLKQFTVEGYEQFMTNIPGAEHYPLFQYITETYHKDCRHVVDIGTRYAASALALGAAGAHVRTFDMPDSSERVAAFRGKTEEEWQTQVKAEGVNVEFYNLDLLQILDEEFNNHILSTWLIVLDTFHEPYSVPFERQFLDRIFKNPKTFEGIMLLDDIYLNDEMKKWWVELQDNADKYGYKVHDITSIGHATGTGLLDFSGKVEITEYP